MDSMARLLVLTTTFLLSFPSVMAASEAWIIRGEAYSNGAFCGTRALFNADAFFYNTGVSSARVQILEVSNGGAPAAPASFDVAPGDVAELGGSHVETYPAGLLWVTHVSIPDDVVIDGALVWHFIDLCKGASPYPYYLGRLTLPVFTALTPAGKVALHPGTDLGVENARTNVGIYNGGDAGAMATVRVYLHSCGAAPVQTRSVSVDPRTAMQVSVPPVAVCDPADPTAYVTVVVDQPSLSWVTTLSNESLPGTTIGSSRQ